MKTLKIVFYDMKFQYRYGFYFLYVLFTVLYIIVIGLLPNDFKEVIAKLLIYTDPATIGLFFMGAIILLEKGQHIQSSLIVAPIKFYHYLAGKVLSLSVISTISATCIAYFTIGISASSVLTVFIGSSLFSVLGILAALFSETMNDFILISTLLELFFCIPGVLFLFHLTPDILNIHFAISIMQGLSGDFSSVFRLVAWSIVITISLYPLMEKRYRKLGGA